MKKIRIYNFLMVFGLFCLVTITMLLKETTQFTPIAAMVLFCFGCAIYVESSITFSVLKVADELKWMNDLGYGLIYVFMKILGLFMVMMGVISMSMDYSNISMISSAYVWLILPLSARRNWIYLGNNYIYTQNTFFRIKDIDSFTKNVVEQGKHVGDTEFIIEVNHKTYKINFKSNMPQSISAFTYALENRNIRV